MEELKNWLNANKIAFKQIDDEVVEIEGLGSMFLADLSGVQSIFKGQEGNLQFNLMESPEVLIEEGICYAAFRFGRNYYYYDLREKFRFNRAAASSANECRICKPGYSHTLRIVERFGRSCALGKKGPIPRSKSNRYLRP